LRHYKYNLLSNMNPERVKKMKIHTNRTLSTIALILLLTISAMMTTMPAANAHTPAWNIPTYSYVTVAPTTTGVGQYTLVVMWLDKYPYTAEGSGGDLWRGFKLDSPVDQAVRVLEESIKPERSPTFRSGKAGGWRTAFNEEHRQLFQKVAGDLVARLGYEA